MFLKYLYTWLSSAALYCIHMERLTFTGPMGLKWASISASVASYGRFPTKTVRDIGCEPGASPLRSLAIVPCPRSWRSVRLLVDRLLYSAEAKHTAHGVASVYELR